MFEFTQDPAAQVAMAGDQDLTELGWVEPADWEPHVDLSSAKENWDAALEALIIESIAETDALAGNSLAVLDDGEIVALAAQAERDLRAATALGYQVTAELARRRPEESGHPDERGLGAYALDELALATGLARGVVCSRVAEADAMTGRHPKLLAALGAGLLPLPALRRVLEATVLLDAEQCVPVETALLNQLGRTNRLPLGDMTPEQMAALSTLAVIAVSTRASTARVAKITKDLVHRIDPAAAVKREARAKTQREVRGCHLESASQGGLFGEAGRIGAVSAQTIRDLLDLADKTSGEVAGARAVPPPCPGQKVHDDEGPGPYQPSDLASSQSRGVGAVMTTNLFLGPSARPDALQRPCPGPGLSAYFRAIQGGPAMEAVMRTSRARHTLRVAELGVAVGALVLGLAVGAVVPANATAFVDDHAGKTDRVYYLALGDSVAAGQQPDGETGVGYVTQLWRSIRAESPTLRLRNLSCGGETSRSMITGKRSPCGYAAGSQLDAAVSFLRRHPGQIAFITIDVGVNDLFERCLDWDRGLLDRPCAVDQLPRLQKRLARILDALTEAGPGVPIIGMTYYNPLLGFWGLVPGGRALARADQRVFALFNAGLATAYEDAGARVADVAATFRSSDFTNTVVVPGRGRLPVNVARTCRWTWFCSPEFFGDPHPNRTGHRMIARTFEVELRRVLP